MIGLWSGVVRPAMVGSLGSDRDASPSVGLEFPVTEKEGSLEMLLHGGALPMRK